MGTVNSSVSPWWATATLNSPELRFALAAAFGQAPAAGVAAETGVIPSGGTAMGAFVPTSNGSGSAPSVSVAPGQLVLQRPTGGTYICTWPTAATVALDLALPASGQTRIDLLAGEVVDPEADSGQTAPATVFRCRTVPGTPGSSPSAPPVPAGVVPLFQWTVNNAGAITNITSRRPWTRSPGGVRFVETGDTRAGSHPGDLRIFATGRIDAWIGGAWITIVSPIAWTQDTAVLSYAGASGGGTGAAGTVTVGSGGSSVVRYKRVGNDLQVVYRVRVGSSANAGSGDITTVLPGGYVNGPHDSWIPCHLYSPAQPANGQPQVDVSGMALCHPNSALVRPFFPVGVLPSLGIDLREATLANGAGSGPGTGVPRVQGYPLFDGGVLTIGPGMIELAA